MSFTKIVFADADSVGDVNFASLQQQGQLQLINKQDFDTNPSHYVDDAHILITNKVVVDEQLLKQAKQLKLICVAATGYNNIDLQACNQYGITVTNVKDYSTLAVAQHTFALLLSWLNKPSQYHQLSTNGSWAYSQHFCLLDLPIADLAGKTLGIIGYGNIGQSVHKIAEAFGMQVLVAERKGQSVREGRHTLEQVISQADIISLHCPLTANNSKLVDQQFLCQMKDSAILVNTARGGLIDESALLNALQQKHIQAALLDGLTTEPPAQDDPLLNANLDNLLVSPHVAWASINSRQKLVDEIALNIQSFTQNKPRNQILNE
ncbi:glycerate dehydrogenase [Catenovulum agarivorans DS-2]|uniref:Glycerate dehydrogenase n=1 Tax=Catenovulum agarivorans DS-2 TaxID=1328313 RepID=W7QDX5_9ALTE|nr:NAD(P)-dependent oxidoreductase [Catenovulum agarivorans]EWH10126.1 glycerate dehydrogenase [Catenovulum agarivorans DS-2]